MGSHLEALLGRGLPGACQAVVLAKIDLRGYSSFHHPGEVERRGFRLVAGVVTFSPGQQKLAQGPWPLL